MEIWLDTIDLGCIREGAKLDLIGGVLSTRQKNSIHELALQFSCLIAVSKTDKKL